MAFLRTVLAAVLLTMVASAAGTVDRKHHVVSPPPSQGNCSAHCYDDRDCGGYCNKCLKGCMFRPGEKCCASIAPPAPIPQHCGSLSWCRSDSDCAFDDDKVKCRHCDSEKTQCVAKKH
jgi:hypothetical protein